MVIVVMGAAGAGKTTIGRQLADELRWTFIEGDDYHPPANVEKMRAGQALSDADRAAWLAALRAIIARAGERRENLVVACSALKERYRIELRRNLRNVRFAYLKASAELLAERLASRRGHFAGVQLLPSQIEALEEPDWALAIDASASPEAIVALIRHEFGV